jgi:hypothetical protein
MPLLIKYGSGYRRLLTSETRRRREWRHVATARRVLGRRSGTRGSETETGKQKGQAEASPAIGELRARPRKRVAAIRKLNARYAGQAFPRRAAEKWNRLNRELDETEELITELRARHERTSGA